LAIARLIIAAPASSSGKTLLSLALCAWAKEQGLAPAAFKAGPDFIDSQYLGLAADREADNLDSWMMGEPGCQQVFERASAGAGLAVIESAMGLYDGKRNAGFGSHSAASLGLCLDAPVLLVLNARKAGPTLAATVLGLKAVEPRLRFLGVVLNFCSGQQHADLLAKAILDLTGLASFGWLPDLPSLRLPERHLGLTAMSEAGDWLKALQGQLPKMAETLRFSAIMAAAKAQARALPENLAPASAPPALPRVRLGVAKDEAFHFYYPENLRLLQAAGAELVFFSPLHDARLPQGCQGLLLGGGFPEMFGQALSGNTCLLAELRSAISAGMPCWAECGGLMLLARELVDLQGQAWPMAGALNARVKMGSKLSHFGYCQVQALADTLPLGAAVTARGHEFHHSTLEWLGPEAKAGWLIKQEGKPDRPEGWLLPNGIATYAHLHLASCPGAAARLVARAREFAQAAGVKGS
jgi:cobyrinic acid a,c-diamide synthase